MLLIFTLVWQLDKSSLREQTEIAWSLTDAKWCAWKVSRRFVKYLAASKLKWSHSDTNHLPWWLVEHISFSSPWQPPVFCTDAVAAMQCTDTPIIDRLLSLPVPISLSPWHCRQTGTSSRRWPLSCKPCGQGRAGRGRRGREDQGSASVHPSTFPSSPFSLWKKHLSALHCISLFKHEGKPFGGHLVVSYETQTRVTSGSDISMWLEALKGSIFLMPYSLLTCVNLCNLVSRFPAPY